MRLSQVQQGCRWENRWAADPWGSPFDALEPAVESWRAKQQQMIRYEDAPGVKVTLLVS